VTVNRNQDSSEELVRSIQAALEDLRDAEKAVAMAAYMKNHFAFLGVPMPARVAALKPLWRRWQPSGDELMRLVQALWNLPEREYQYAALGALDTHWKRLESSQLEGLCSLVATQKPWWDTVDSLTTRTVGSLVRRDSSLVALMDAFAESPNLWLRRIAILHQINAGATADGERLFRLALLNADHESFWIRKAIGWALREYAKRNASATLEFVEKNDERFSRLTVREALKHF
jgi:3-methyladenine DNA glycosylase AlkD